jgi:hypothetical protein
MSPVRSGRPPLPGDSTTQIGLGVEACRMRSPSLPHKTAPTRPDSAVRRRVSLRDSFPEASLAGTMEP